MVFLLKYWKILAIVAGVLLLLILVTHTVSSWQAGKYQKESQKYHAAEQAWQVERAGIIARAEISEKHAAELEPKAAAFDALAQQHKAIDAQLAKQIEEVSKDAGTKETMANQPTDCRVRAKRVCDLLSANHINHDCGAITRESCPEGQ